MNEEPSVTEADLARVLELDAKATRGPFFISESYGDVSVMADDDGKDPWTICHMADPLGYDGVEQRMSNAEAYVQYRTLTPRLARELIAARAALDAAPIHRLDESRTVFIERYKKWYREQRNAALTQLNTHTHE